MYPYPLVRTPVARLYIQPHVLRSYSKSTRVTPYISSVCVASICTTGTYQYIPNPSIPGV